MPPWVERPTITIDIGRLRKGESPTIPADAVASAKALLEEVLAPVPKKARMLAYLLALRTGNRFGREFQAGAKLIDGDPRDVALANLSYELVLGSYACSTMALPTPDGPVVARNMDWAPEGPLARASYVFRCVEGNDWKFTTGGFPGAVGVVTGLSSRGFAVVINAVPPQESILKSGYPVLLQIRRVLEDASDFDDAVAMLSKQRLTTAALFTVVGTKNEQRVCIERSSRRAALRWARIGEPLLTTNNYIQMEDFGSRNTGKYQFSEATCSRYERLQFLTSHHTASQPIGDDEMLYWLADPEVRQDITAQHVLIRPAIGEMKLFVPRYLVSGG